MHPPEPLLLSATRISTFLGNQALTAGTGFFFRRDGRLYLVTSLHVLHDAPTNHLPDRIEFMVHLDAQNLTRFTAVTLPLYRDQVSLWKAGTDSGGQVDIAVLRVADTQLPRGALLHAFEPADLKGNLDTVEVGQPILLVGFPLGFYDVVHHLPVVRQGSIASAFGVRFQGKGYFLTDARMHRGASGAPVVLGTPGARKHKLLGVHSARMDMSGRDAASDDVLGLNCAWYADMLITLTNESADAAETG